MDNKPLISIIMNCHNGATYLRRAIESVFEQTYENWELIFWDNLSNDSSELIAKSFGAKLRYFKSEVFLSLGSARNEALKKCKGDYIAFLDVDDLWSPLKLETQIYFFSNPNIMLVYTNTIYINQDDVYLSRTNKEHYLRTYTKTFRDLLLNYDIVLSSVIISRMSLTDHEWFDPKLEYAEEYDLFLRIMYFGKSIKLGDYLTYNRLHENSITHSKFFLISSETDYVLDKLLNLWPVINREYFFEINILRNQNIQQKFLELILTRDLLSAREMIAHVKYKSFKNMLFYLISFLGIKTVMFLWKITRHVKKKGKIKGL